MSKFLDETEKTQQPTIRNVATGPFDITSLVRAIKQREAPAQEQESGRVSRRLIDISKGESQLHINLENPEPCVAKAREAYRSLRTRLMKMQASDRIHSVMITSSIPNEGKTITSLNLAVSCAQLRDTRILLVDADLRSRGLTELLKATNEPGLSDILTGKSLIQDTIAGTEHQNLFFVAAGSPNSQPAELFAGPRWAEFVSWADESFDIVLVDGPPILSFTDAELIATRCDGALMVVRALSTPREIVQKCASRLPKKKILGAVFNGVPEGPESRYGYYGSYGGTNGGPNRS